MSGPVDRDTWFRLYGSEVSYFTAKLRPALRYKRVPFVEILATPAVYRLRTATLARQEGIQSGVRVGDRRGSPVVPLEQRRG